MVEDKKAKKIVFQIISSYFTKINPPKIPRNKLKKVHDLITATTMDGIAFQVLKEKPIPKTILDSLKKGYLAIKEIDSYHKKLLFALEKVPEKMVLFKDAQFKIHSSYKSGLRYSCDVDVLVFENKFVIDEKLVKNNFYLYSADINRGMNFVKKAHKANKNVLVAPFLYDTQKKMLRNKKSFYESKKQVSLNKFKDYELIKNRIDQINERRKNNYFHKFGGMLNLHYELFGLEDHFRIRKDDLLIKKYEKNVFFVHSEDNLIILACRFINNLYKYKHSFAYNGFLKYVVDIHFILQSKKINWLRVIEIAQKTNSSSQLWFYLYLGKKYFGCPIPKEVLQKIKSDGSIIQNIIFKKINPLNLLFNEQDIWVKLYSKCYLEFGLLFSVMRLVHSFIAKLKRCI